MALEESILEWLLKPRARYKGMYVNILGLPAFSPYSEGSIKNSFGKLKKSKYILNDGKNFRITPLGKKYLEKGKKQLTVFKNNFNLDAPKNLMVIYDVPEAQKIQREWFRGQLRIFGYKMIQRSVWVGPGPLPKEFLVYVEDIGLKDRFKTFKLAKPYSFEK